MKKINEVGILIVFAILGTGISFAQIPQKFNYQAVVRNSSGNLIINKTIAVRVKIHDQSPSGPVVYIEKYQKTTNAYGLLNLEIGDGLPYYGSFSAIDWANGSKFLEIQIDENGGVNYAFIGVTELLSVPYALYAQNVLNTEPFDVDSTNELQYLTLAGKSLSITNGNTVILKDNDSTNELQQLSLSGKALSISKGNTVMLKDNDSTNELQRLLMNGDSLFISKGNNILLPYLKTQWWSKNGPNIYYNSGNVGVGTSAPGYNLEVYSPSDAWTGIGTGAANGNAGLFINKGSNTASTSGIIGFSTGGSSKWLMGLILGDHFSLSRNPGFADGTFFIDGNNSRIGIGTTAPTVNLEIKGTDSSFIRLLANSSSGSSGLIINKGASTNTNNASLIYITGNSFKWSAGMLKNDDYTVSRSAGGSDGSFIIKQGSGFVGIGTTNPQTLLFVSDNLDATGTFNGTSNSANAGLVINKGVNSTACNAIVTFQAGSVNKWHIGLVKEDNFSISRSSGASDGAFFINRTSGYTGIGTFNPLYKLDLRDNTQAFASLMGTTSTASAGLYINKGSTTSATNGVIAWMTGSTGKWYAGTIRSDNFAISRTLIAADGTFFINRANGFIGIGTVNPRNGLQVNQNIRIPGYAIRYIALGDNYGVQLRQDANYFKIDQIDTSANPTPTTLITMDMSMATIAFQPWQNNAVNSGSAPFAWKYVYGVNAYQQTSDVRLKKEIKELDYGLNTIMKLRPVSFYWINDAEQGRKIGFIAQEVKGVLPEVVRHTTFTDNQVRRWNEEGRPVTENDIYTMANSDIIPVLVKAIQEQQQMILNLQNELNELKSKSGN